jgi:hypothetical protein
MTGFVDRNYRGLVFAIWLLTSLLLFVVARDAIAIMKMGDPDDQLRLVQVRDWLAGQSWWDVKQHRMNLPFGGPMHWSRLVDIPIAGMILLLRPFLDQAAAEQWAAAIVPILTYGCVLSVFAGTANRLFGKGAALLAAATFFAVLPASRQFLPMRIDHHGWQLFCFFAAAYALFDPRRSLSAAATIGLAMALWIEISIEGLPFAIIFMAALGLRWLFPAFDRGQKELPNDQLPVALATLAAGSMFFFVVTKGLKLTQNFCDGLSPVHMAAFASVAIVIGGATLLARAKGLSLSFSAKLIISIFAVIAGLSAVLAIAPQCTSDAFAELDPLVRRYWYNRVPEGLPVWAAPLQFVVLELTGIAFGAIGLAWVLFRSTVPAKPDRLVLTILFISSALVGALVSRTMVYAVCLGTIMLSAMAITVLHNAKRALGLSKRMALRVVAVFVLFPALFGQNIINIISVAKYAEAPKGAVEQKAFETLAIACQKPTAANMLNRLPAAQLMVGLDTSPAVLQFTHHKVVATGHHRNQLAMADVIRTFTGTADQAKAVMEQRKVRYLITCDGSFELRVYQKDAPNGFWAQMQRGALPTWLVPQPDIGPFKVWRTDWTRG